MSMHAHKVLRDAAYALCETDPRYRAALSADRNVADSLREGSVAPGLGNQSELWLTTYASALDDIL